MTIKLGRRPARRTRRNLLSALAMVRALDPLGSPPAASNDYTAAVKIPWPMFLNDILGTCVPADTAHTLMLRTANAGSIIVPSDADVEYLYEKVGGYDPEFSDATDNGCDESSMEEYLQSTGFIGHKATATGTVEPSNLDHVRWCIQLFGSCRLGINLPQSAMNQFNASQPWTVIGDASFLGGHDVPLVGYDASWFYGVTWGAPIKIAPNFILEYVDECHSEIFADWVRAQGTAPSGFDLSDLITKLPAVGTA